MTSIQLIGGTPLPIAEVQQMLVRPISQFGRFTIFFTQAIKRCFVPVVSPELLIRQLEFVGNRSFGIVLIAAVMIGAIFGLILGDMFRPFGAESMLGAAAGIALPKELAPVVCAMLVTARAGSSMAAEIATMRVNEQIDAMRVMAVDPISYLVAPRVIAGFIMVPLLTAIFILTGVFSSFLIGVAFFDIDVGTFMEKMRWMVKFRYIIQGMEKAAVFGISLTAIGCYKGFYAGGGAKGVGRATTEAVVISLVAIVIADLFVSYLQFEPVF